MLPLALASAVGVDGAPVELDEVTHDAETEPEAAVHACRGLAGLREVLEDLRQVAYHHLEVLALAGYAMPPRLVPASGLMQQRT